MKKIIGSIEFSIYSKEFSNDKMKEYDIEVIFNNIVKYLDSQLIKYSRDNEYQGNNRKICLMVYGIKIIYDIGKKKEEGNMYSREELSKIYFKISSFNFEKSFDLFIKLLLTIPYTISHYIRFSLHNDYSYLAVEEDVASIIANANYFDFDESSIGGYYFNNLNLKFYFFEETDRRNNIISNIMSIVYDCKSVSSDHIIDLIYKLYEIGIIYNKREF